MRLSTFCVFICVFLGWIAILPSAILLFAGHVDESNHVVIGKLLVVGLICFTAASCCTISLRQGSKESV